ncbi:MAG: T9SS type A sorting domain-containing protein, partial [Gemmatimonadetes bacterium]|nr:T9SS type A sorting domain-containing protein [Gemmatimonadota bacterium]
IAVTPTTAAAPTVPSSLSASTGLEPVFSFTNAIPFTTSNSLSYTIQVSTQTDFSDVTVSESDISEGSASTSWTSTRELTEGVVYYWRVRAVEGDLSGPFSETQTFTAEALPELKGDFSGDGAVDFDDFFSFVAAFGKPYVDNPEFDLDGSASGVIDFNDFFAFVAVFGTRSAGKTWAFAHRLDDSARLWLDAEASIMGVDHQGKGNADGIDDAVRVRIWADDVSQLSAFGLVMAYDPHLVEFVDAAEGPGHLLESQGGETGLFSVLHQRPGILLIGNGLSNGEPVGGNGLLAEVSFRLLDRERANDAGFALREAFIARDVGDVRRVMSLTGASVEPMHFALSQAYPNPFNPSTQIEFAIAQDTPTSLTVYDVLGQRVRTLVRAVDGLGAGFYSVTWDGTDHQGRPVGNGLYFYRLATPAFQRTGKMMMIK